MRYGIFSDVHSNLEAFRAVIKAMEGDRVKKYICVGDIVGYGADPSDCITLARELTDETVCGNHDWASVGLVDTLYFNDYAKRAVLWTMNHISEDEKGYLRDLRLTIEGDEFVIVHGSLDEPEEFHYVIDVYGAHRTFDKLDKKICFVGHSHSPVIFVKSSEIVNLTTETRTEIAEDVSYIVNVGSVGQPRDGDPRACYVIYDTKANVIETKRVPYQIKKAQEKIRNAGLPQILADRLEGGR